MNNSEKMEVREAGDGAPSGEYVQSPPKKYSWTEVRQAVHDLRKELSALCTMVPMALSFRKLKNGNTRIYFLRTPHNGWEITVLYSDVDLTVLPNTNRLEWKSLIESNIGLVVRSGKWSREEQLLWERQRVAAWGIASYELHPKSGRVLFPCASSLVIADAPPGDDDVGWQPPPLVPRVLSTGGGAPLTPALCPHDPGLVAHTARGDIWVAGNIARPARLTYACGPGPSNRLVDEPRQAGVPCYVTQEEFSRYTGFWWQPVCEDGIYRIVYEEVDESDVKIFSFPSSQSPTGEVEEFRFPRAGSPNAKSHLRLVTFRLQKATPVTVLDYYQEGAGDATHSSNSGSETMEVTDIRWWELHTPLQESFPWFEYLARVGWTPCGQFVWVQLLDRCQQRLELVLVPLASFCRPSGYGPTPPPTQHYQCPMPQVLVKETAPNAWINVHDVLHFLSCTPSCAGAGVDVSFIWASEDTGFMHLYHITARMDLASKGRKVMEMMSLSSEEDSNAATATVLSRDAITAGDWEVIAKKIWVDVPRMLVYFVGLRESPLERQLYVASLTPPMPQVTLLTTPGQCATVDMDDECTVAVITQSNINTLPCTRVYRLDHSGGKVTLVVQATLMERPNRGEVSECGSWNGSRESSSTDGDDIDAGLDSSPGRLTIIREHLLPAMDIPPAQILETTLSCGFKAYCTLWRCGLGGRRPTVLHVYGGPEVQTVTNSYKGIRQLRMHMLAARGFNVVSVDSRGSKHRGRAWEAAIKGKLGQLELDDQVEVLQWLAKETGCIDMERVAIHGWSYGGYLSLLGLATRPHVFKLCVAGAPVTCWRLYDTAYTERYMSPPAHNAHAYTRASVIAHAPFFPDQDGRLLIIHGLSDENVHFCHTAALLAELVRLGKPHRVQIYPGERHSLRAMHAAKHYEATLLHFLHENL